MEEIIKWGAYVIAGLLGFWGVEMRKEITKLKEDVAATRLHNSETYAKKDELKDMFQPVLRKLDKLEEYLIVSLQRKDNGL